MQAGAGGIFGDGDYKGVENHLSGIFLFFTVILSIAPVLWRL